MHTDPSSIDLARAPAFALRAARVEPAALRVTAPDGTSHTLQPRPMQVLVALHRAGDRTVTREDLNRSCWGGRAVGDDALDRVIAQLRRLAEACAGAFSIDTIPRVGFRLIADDAPAPPPLPDPLAYQADDAGRTTAREALRLLERALALEPDRRSPLMLVALCRALLELDGEEGEPHDPGGGATMLGRRDTPTRLIA